MGCVIFKIRRAGEWVYLTMWAWRLRRSQYLLWVLYRMYNLFIFFSSRSFVDPFLSVWAFCVPYSPSAANRGDQRIFMFEFCISFQIFALIFEVVRSCFPPHSLHLETVIGSFSMVQCMVGFFKATFRFVLLMFSYHVYLLLLLYIASTVQKGFCGINK